jgi:hypothetical protein
MDYIIPTDPNDDDLAEWQVENFYRWEAQDSHVDAYLEAQNPIWSD